MVKNIEIRLIIGESIEELKRSQWRKYIEQMGPNPLSSVPFWRQLNIIKHGNKSQNVGSLIHNNLKVSTMKKKRNYMPIIFKKYFQNRVISA